MLCWPQTWWAHSRHLQLNVMVAFFIPGIVYLADAVGTPTETVGRAGTVSRDSRLTSSDITVPTLFSGTGYGLTLPAAAVAYSGMLLDGLLPVYDVSDAVATVVEADRTATWDPLILGDLIEVGRQRPLVGALGRSASRLHYALHIP